MASTTGRTRTRPPARRVQVDRKEELLAEVDAELLAGAVAVAAGASPYRVVIEMALEMWLDQQWQQSGRAQQMQQQSDLGRTLLPSQQSDALQIREQHARQVPRTPSDAPKGRQAAEE